MTTDLRTAALVAVGTFRAIPASLAKRHVDVLDALERAALAASEGTPAPVSPEPPRDAAVAAALALSGMAHDLVPGIRHDFGLAALDYLTAYPEHKAAIGAFCAAPPLQGSSSSQSPTPATPSLDAALDAFFEDIDADWSNDNIRPGTFAFRFREAAERLRAARLTAAASSEEGTWEPSADDPREWGDYFADREDPA